jgi:CHAD domain-containing protein
MSSPLDLLDRRPEEGARLIARKHLSALRRAARHVHDRDDDEAVHDVRVAIRKLRGALAAYQDVLPRPLVRRCRKRLAGLMDATGPAREGQVALAMLAKLPQEAATAWLARRWDVRWRRDVGRARRRIDAKLRPALGSLRETLAAYRVRVRTRPEPRFRSTVAVAAAAEAARLAYAAASLRAGAPGGEHRVRLAAKRLRYLLEPFEDLEPGVEALCARLTLLQDALGQARDRALLVARLQREAQRAPRALRPAVRALAATTAARLR